MASTTPSTDMEEEVRCPICLEYLTDLVTLECGHNFCRACITDYCETWEKHGDLECPVCRFPIKKGDFRRNCQLANIVEKLKLLHIKPTKEPLCIKHKKELNLFCIEDGELVCVACERSPEHRAHVVLLLEEAVSEYKEKMKARLISLEKERKNLVAQKLAEEQGIRECLAQLELEKKKTRSAFMQMHNFLEQKELLQLAQLEDLEEKFKTRLEENITRLSEKISSISSLIAIAEGKWEQPAREFLQETRSALSSYEKEQGRQLIKCSPELEERLKKFSQNNCILKKAMETCEETLEQALIKLNCYPEKEGIFPLSLGDDIQQPPKAPKKVNVILDPDTAHPRLILSWDLKSVKWESTYRTDLPDNHERFDLMPGVLGCETFTSGSYWWEVEVDLKGEMWALGIVRETVRRKGEIRHSPNEGIWVMGKTSHPWVPFNYWAFTSPNWTPLLLRHNNPRKIRVSLDYEKGTVEFFDVGNNKSIFTFHSLSFNGEGIRPAFFLWRQARITCGI
ncbi:tripartite motif-containing protein 10-like [Eublepharis macularius]|uniref:Tripartite motif-containing protein 10-like n=1 Tax=Eublepharis macularius TaxID=481883 RepID=A0AA97JAL4_EUBMA|nr:tripartite motif-containing protein 10-like [Eublepharis macularius]